MNFQLFESIFYIGSFLGGGAVVFFFFRTIWRLLKTIEPENRLVEIWMVFLLLIPGVNVVFALWFFPMVCNSAKREFQSMGKMNYNYPLKFVGIGIPVSVLMFFGTLFVFESYSLRSVIGIDRALADILMFFSVTSACLLFILFWIGLGTYRDMIVIIRNSDETEGMRFDNSDLLDR